MRKTVNEMGSEMFAQVVNQEVMNAKDVNAVSFSMPSFTDYGCSASNVLISIISKLAQDGFNTAFEEEHDANGYKTYYQHYSNDDIEIFGIIEDEMDSDDTKGTYVFKGNEEIYEFHMESIFDIINEIIEKSVAY